MKLNKAQEVGLLLGAGAHCLGTCLQSQAMFNWYSLQSSHVEGHFLSWAWAFAI